jgi:hypothetical protein
VPLDQAAQDAAAPVRRPHGDHRQAGHRERVATRDHERVLERRRGPDDRAGIICSPDLGRIDQCAQALDTVRIGLGGVVTEHAEQGLEVGAELGIGDGADLDGHQRTILRGGI